MAKANLALSIPVGPLAAFNIVVGAMGHCGVKPFRQEGWSVKGQENVSLFKMGYPATVTATVHPTPEGGSHIELQGENFGFALNRVHLEGVLRRIAEAVQHSAAAMPPMPIPPPTVLAESSPPPAAEESGLPPRLI